MDEYKALRDALWAKKVIEDIEHRVAEVKILEKVASGGYVFEKDENGNLVIRKE